MKVTSAALLPYLDPLRALPFVQKVELLATPLTGFDARHGVGHDGALRLHTPTGSWDFVVELRGSHLDRITAEHLVRAVGPQGPPCLLLAPHIGGPLGELLEAHDINFLDRRGNCRIRIEDRYLARVDRHTAARPRASERALRSAGYQTLLALLVEPALAQAPLRTIAEAAGTSITAPRDMLLRLVQEGFLVDTRAGRRWVEHRRGELVDRFLVGYRDVLRPRLLIGRYRTPHRDPQVLEARLLDLLGPPEAWRFGGAAGAYRVAKYYRSGITALHHPSLPPDLPVRLPALQARDGDLVLLRMPGPIATEHAPDGVVHPVLLCAELLVEPDERARDAAADLRERFLKP